MRAANFGWRIHFLASDCLVRTFHGLPVAPFQRDCALTIGNFDGVHRGHQALLARLRAGASARGLPAVVCTFEPHPREYFAALSHEAAQARTDAARLGAEAARPGTEATAPGMQVPRPVADASPMHANAGRPGSGAPRPAAPPRVSTLRDKVGALAACGIDAVCVLRFDQTLAAMDAEAFVARVLAGGLRTRHLLIGDDFRFGARRRGDFAMLRAAGPRHGFSVERMDTVTDGAPDDEAGLAGAAGMRVSSSALREALAAGDLDRACALLGRPYAVSGRVLHGRKLGRTLGFPTLNQRLWRPGVHALVRPALSGVFAVRVHGLPGAAGSLPGVASLGTRPAVERDGAWLLETHVFDYAGNAYGHCVRVEFVAKLRDEAHYDSLDALAAQIDRDAREARRILAADTRSTAGA